MNFIKKWYIYQKERFPVLTYGMYILAVIIAVFCYCNYKGKIMFQNILTTNQSYQINYCILIPMFIVGFLQFLMVRIVDEFKDYEEDCKYRPYRPVPRGLITLKELKVLLVICILLQFVVTFFINKTSIVQLLLVWTFFAIMSKNFFIKKFLDKHILVEVLLDELIMPIFIMYLASFIKIDVPSLSSFLCLTFFDIWPLLLMSYIISWIVEIARKVRCKEDEEKGVKTYTKVFGIKKSVIMLIVLETILMIISSSIQGKKYLFISIGLYAIAVIINLIFAIIKSKKTAKFAELSNDLYVMMSYFSLILLII